MKKFFLMLSAVVMTASAVFTSCDDDKDNYTGQTTEQTGTENPIPEPEPSDIGTVSLFGNLTAFNDSVHCAYEANLSSDVTRAGWRKWFRKLVTVVCADISGARGGSAIGGIFGPAGSTVGATVGAAIFSWKAGAECFGYQTATGTRASYASMSPIQLQVESAYAKTLSNAAVVNDVSTVSINVPTKFASSAMLVGKSHNAILNLCQDAVEVASVEDITGVLTNDQIAVIHSDAFVSMVNNAVESGNYSVAEGDIVGNQIIDMFMEVFEDCAESQDDLQYIINRYISIIEENGSLPDDVKEMVYNALSVAAYSCDYWVNFAQ